MATTSPRLAHVVLQTGRPDEMTDFYTTLLDGHVVFAGHNLTFITCDEEHHRIAFVAPPEGLANKDMGAAGMHHVAFTFEELDDLLARYEFLAERGIQPATPVQHGVTTSLYYRDPDGNFVELQIDNFADPDEATAYMNGPDYEEDGVGPAFDVVRMIEARRAGASVAELTTRSWAKSGPALPDPMIALTAPVVSA
ncbi:biphenyl 2,3-dioxygenase [Rhodococcus rhodnii]|uniref:Extradiol dioxygenase n=2 Tax=Rhodococcus rhodnii TaxID=38312 RepID=R7WNM8_9NOCA|nr:VOC family protein [Rhodococcus rhodnii]EOM76875.1 extradiol dioxygenase [Rhodococcus rhodnii LMG 5362]TXG89759.1 biphenyl 2,3-dioxygenase [Rhodococcus rhodnii]